jgi:hypothetical protein
MMKWIKSKKNEEEEKEKRDESFKVFCFVLIYNSTLPLCFFLFLVNSIFENLFHSLLLLLLFIFVFNIYFVVVVVEISPLNLTF